MSEPIYDPQCSPEANGVARQCLLWVLADGEPILPIDQERCARLIQGAMDQWAANKLAEPRINPEWVKSLEDENARLRKALERAIFCQ